MFHVGIFMHNRRNFFYIQDIASELLLHYCDKYVNNLVRGRLRTPGALRHAQHVPCLCQFVQSQFFHMTNSAINR